MGTSKTAAAVPPGTRDAWVHRASRSAGGGIWYFARLPAAAPPTGSRLMHRRLWPGEDRCQQPSDEGMGRTKARLERDSGLMARKARAEFLRWFGPLLAALRDLGDSGRPREASARIARHLNLSDEVLDQTLKSGAGKCHNQVAWARQCRAWVGSACRVAARPGWITAGAARALARTAAGTTLKQP
jgi:Mrr N-terminal domain